ncbi:MAG: hypothetical protein MUE73_11155 [Planctomycetes bacterium]|jgi:hypothetical protein|nr:hypothetical protein [Planctomycetota bacterium]
MRLRHLFFVLACAGVGIGSFFSCDPEYRGGQGKLLGHLRRHLVEVAGGLRRWAEDHGGWPAAADGLPALDSLPNSRDLRGRSSLDAPGAVRSEVFSYGAHEVHCLTGAGPLTPFLLPYLYENRTGGAGAAGLPMEDDPAGDWSVEVAPGVFVLSAEARILSRELTRLRREMFLVLGGAGAVAVAFGLLFLRALRRDEARGRVGRGPVADALGVLLLLAAVFACVLHPTSDPGRTPEYGYFHSVRRPGFAAAVAGALRAYRDAGALSPEAYGRTMAAMERDGEALWNPEVPFSRGSR